MKDANTPAEVDQLDVLRAKLIELRDATDEVLTYIDMLTGFERLEEFNPSCGVMNQLTDAMRSVGFVSKRVRMDIGAEGADSLVVTH